MPSNLKNVIVSFFKSILKNKKLSTYAFFFFIAFSFWFLSILSRTHETTLQIPVKYINYPPDLVEENVPKNLVDVRVKAPGFSIFFFHFFNFKQLSLRYDLANSKPTTSGKNFFWIMNSNRKSIADVLGSSMEIMNISPAKLAVSFTNKSKKEVPVILNSDINIKQTYWLSEEIAINPLRVMLYGDNNRLDNLTSITTELLQLTELDNDVNQKVELRIPDELQCKTTFVDVQIKVEPFIEELFEQKVEVRNLREGYTLKLFPGTINITLRLPQDKYNLLKTDFLHMYIDASDISDQNTLEVQHDNIPSFVKLERIYPKRLEFLLIKE